MTLRLTTKELLTILNEKFDGTKLDSLTIEEPKNGIDNVIYIIDEEIKVSRKLAEKTLDEKY